MTDIDAICRQFENALISVDRGEADRVITAAAEQFSQAELSEMVVSRALERIGDDWDKGTVALSQVFMASQIAEKTVGRLFGTAVRAHGDQPPIAIAVLDDYHMLGKRMVVSAVQAAGYDIQDWGRMEPAEIVPKVKSQGVKILLLSTLMLRAALKVQEVRGLLKDEGVDVTIFVGGAPFRFDSELWQQVGADAMGASATEAVHLIAQSMVKHYG